MREANTFQSRKFDTDDSELLGAVEARQEFGKTEYLSYKSAVDLVKQNQPEGGSPIAPPAKFAYDLRQALAGILAVQDQNDLKFFTAIGSSLDHHHGVDGIFEYHFAGKWSRITFDITFNPSKDQTKSDYLMHVRDDEVGLDGSPERYQALIQYEADELARLIKLRINDRAVGRDKNESR